MATAMDSTAATIVLVHGAWHGGWCWERLTPKLEQRGFAVRTVDLPSVGARARRAVNLSADAAAVRAVIDDIPGKVLLCGHSYGGMVISHATVAQPNVVRLVYVCAFMPEEGESLSDIGGGELAPWINLLDGGLTLPDAQRCAEVFYADCDAPTQQWAQGRLQAQSIAAFGEAVARPAWKSIPSTYVVCANDMAIPPELQRGTFAPRATEAVELDSSHSPFVSRPAELAEVLIGSAMQVTGK